MIGPDVRELIDAGYLAPFRYLAPNTGSTSRSVRSHRRRLQQRRSRGGLDQDGITGNVVEHYLKHLAGRTAIAFCVTVAHAEHVAQRFRDAGISAASIDGTMSSEQRHDLVNRLRTGEHPRADLLRDHQRRLRRSRGRWGNSPAADTEFRAVPPAGRTMPAAEGRRIGGGHRRPRRQRVPPRPAGRAARVVARHQEARPRPNARRRRRMPDLPNLQRGLRDRCRARRVRSAG